MKKVLFVDDESFILRSLKRLFKNEPYETVFLSSGVEALAYLEEHTVDLVISDIRMPEMDGFELLSAIKTKYPKTLRVALSGFADSKTIFKLIEKNAAKLYLFKPWDNDELKLNIHNILEFEDILMSNKLLELINNIDSLPTLPELYSKIKKLISENADIDAVGKLVEQDQAISSKILRLANSAYYGRKTGDIKQAIMGIGLKNLTNLILASSVFTSSTVNVEKMEELWQHSISTNKLTIEIYNRLLDKKIPSIYGSAGLLHDIGKVILYTYYADTYNDILRKIEEDDTLLVEEELIQYNITHQDIGAYLLNWWELPYAYVEAAMYHHRPSDQRVINKELIAVVHLADYFSLEMIGEQKHYSRLDPEAFKILDITQESVEKLVVDIMQE